MTHQPGGCTDEGDPDAPKVARFEVRCQGFVSWLVGVSVDQPDSPSTSWMGRNVGILRSRRSQLAPSIVNVCPVT